MLSNGLTLFGIDDAASAINGKQVPLTPPKYAVACLQTFAHITHELVRIFYSNAGVDMPESKDYPNMPLTNWPHELLIRLADEVSEFDLFATDKLNRHKFTKAIRESAPASLKNISDAGALAHLQLVKPYVPIFGEDFKEFNGKIYLGNGAAASFWDSLNQIAIALGFFGDAEIHVSSFFEGKTVGDWLDTRFSEIAESLSRVAAKVANSAGKALGAAGKGFFSEIGVTGAVVVGIGGFIAAKRTGLL